MLKRSPDREAIEVEIERIRSLGLEGLRNLWRTTFRSPPPSGFTKDLMARFRTIFRRYLELGSNLIERYVDRVIIKPQAVEVRLTPNGSAESPGLHGDEPEAEPIATTLTLPWSAPTFAAVKGIVHRPTARPAVAPETRHALLSAIAKARSWIEDLRLGRAATLTEIAKREGLGERSVRLLAPLAFVAPSIVTAIADGTAPADLTVTGLARRLPDSWASQENRL